MTIKALRLLPPLAFARFGSASVPQANYELVDDRPLGFRQIRPADTLIVQPDGTLTIQEGMLRTRPADPSEERAEINKMFREGDRIRPVAPFFEVWAITDERPELVPLTLRLLADHEKLDASAILWRVHVENRKVFRRTGDAKDKVVATTPWFSDQARQWLTGTCDNCRGSISFGNVQFVQPNATDKVCSRVRLRFTPAPGRIYGPLQRRLGVPDDSGYVKPIYKGAEGEGTWSSFDDTKPGKGMPHETLPPSLYANTNPLPAAPWLNHDSEQDRDRAESRGYLDDACDGFIHVRIEGRDALQAKARICVAPPAFVPDSQFVRSLADDLDQIVFGPGADDIRLKDARKRALDIVRRAYETVRFMNTAVSNGNSVDGRPAEAFDTMPAEEAFATERPVRPVMAPANADNAAVLALHQHVFAALSSGTAPWFVSLLRKPEEAGDLTDKGRRKMPALMSGADAYYLALTRRQIATIEKAAKGEAVEPRNLTARAYELNRELRHEAIGNPVTSRPEMAIGNCCPGLEVDFRAVWRRLFEGIELSEWENVVVKAGPARDENGNEVDLKDLQGHRLLRVGQWNEEGKFDGTKAVIRLEGRSPSNPGGKVIVRSNRNPNGAWTMEWSNCLAYVVNKVQAGEQEWFDCEFTANVPDFPELPTDEPERNATNSTWIRLRARKLFEGETAVLSEELAQPGELTQGLCSPWQNDLRECSCFYWAGSRPDFVNTTIGKDGLTHGDYWYASSRTGEYVPDDYADTRLMTYDDMFREWERLLQFQIAGKDSAPELLDPPDEGET
jgi:hypothetical protein